MIQQLSLFHHILYAVIFITLLTFRNVNSQSLTQKHIHNDDSTDVLNFLKLEYIDSVNTLTEDINNKVDNRLFKGLYGLHYTLYPSPVNEHTTLNMYVDMMISEIRIYNIIGSEFTCKYIINRTSAELFTRELPIGRYILKVNHSRGISVIPLVVMR